MNPAFSLTLAMSLLLPGVARSKDSVYEFTLPSGLDIRIVEAPLTSSTHPNCRRNGRPVKFMEYRPRTYVKDISVAHAGKRIHLDSTCMTDAWNGRPLEHKGSIRYFGGTCEGDGESRFCVLRGVFADASESFVAEWTVSGSTSSRTVLSSSIDILDLFFRNIDGER
jgi:hypothetical protein